MRQYLTYDEYTERGGTLPKEKFIWAEFRAQKRVDFLTDCRVRGMAEVPEEVKLCIVSLIKADSRIGVEAQAEDQIITSYNTDGYSESYGSAADQIAALQKSMDATVREMLYGVLNDDGIPLLYRGLDA